jgi:hypothetical protein
MIMKKKFAILLLIELFGNFLAYAQTPTTWKNIKVNVTANQPVTTTQTLKEQANGFQRLMISLSNKGQLPLTIEKITISIPINEILTDNLEMVYGGSCMGQTPV